LGAVQHFGKHSSCHPQDEYVLVGQFWLSYVGQGVGEALDMMELTGRVEEMAAIQ
jgi:hypothetical protein